MHKYYNGHVTALFPEMVRRHYLCGPRPLYPIRHSYASFTSGVLFEKKVESLTRAQIQQLFNAFNVKWIVCWSGETLQALERFPEYIHKIREIGRLKIFSVDRQPSFFLKGNGSVTADYNRLELENVVAEGGEIILSYHWMARLQTDPPLIIEPAFLAGDPVGFIKVKAPPAALIIYNAY